MKISHNWLKQYVPIGMSPASLAERLSMAGLEVEQWTDQSDQFGKFVVGEVHEVEKHPNADRLTVCSVDVGREKLSIVCGAPNVAAGQKVAVGLVGAVIPRNQHDPAGEPFELRDTSIRGVRSHGMICSEFELGIGPDADGILVLPAKSRVGAPLARALGKNDIVYDLEITANRGDWLSHFGVAREVSALTGKKWKRPRVSIRESKVRTSAVARVKIADRKGCPRYSARVLRNVVIGESPAWLRQYLTAVGVRPINTVVDVTNFVMMETGQPLHAFDFDTLAGGTIIVRSASKGEHFVTLDGKGRVLRDDTLMICDAEKPVAVGGVMGGANSEISEETKNVLIESAHFDPVRIRRTAKHFGLSTEASQRFERYVDIDGTLYAANRAAQLLQEITGAEVLKGALDVYPVKMKGRHIQLRSKRLNQILGTDLTTSQIAGHLRKLGLAIASATQMAVRVRVPTFRNDLNEEIDLIEEVARMVGYDSIEPKMTTRVEFSSPTPLRSTVDDLRDYWVGAGFHETIAPSLQSHRLSALSGGNPVTVLNPVSVDMALLRTSLIPGILQVIKHNKNQSQRDIRVFEIGRVYEQTGEGDPDTLDHYREEARLLLAMSGAHHTSSHGLIPKDVDFFDMKGEMEAFLSKFFLDKNRLIHYDSDKALTADNVGVEIHGTYVGYFGRLKKEIAREFDLEDEVFVAELNLDKMQVDPRRQRRFEPLPKYPSVTRDLAFVVGKDVPQVKVADVIREAGGSILARLSLFDVYEGEQLGANEKSLAYALEFQPLEHTLTDGEANQIIDRIVRDVGRVCGGRLRG